MSKNLIDALRENDKIQNSLSYKKSDYTYPQIKSRKIDDFHDTSHSFIKTNIKPFSFDKRVDYSPIFDFMKLDHQNNQSEHLGESNHVYDKYNLNKLYKITNIHPIEHIPDAFFQYKMAGKTVDDLRLNNLREEAGTKTEFHSLIEQGRSGETLEHVEDNDYDRNLNYVLVRAKTNLKRVEPPIIEKKEEEKEEKEEEKEKKEDETKKISEREEDELDKLMNKKLFKTQHSEKRNQEYKQEFESALNSFLNLNYTEEQIQLVTEKRKVKKEATEFTTKDGNFKNYVDRLLKNIYSKQQRDRVKGKTPGTLDMKSYEKTEDKKTEDENTKIGSYFDIHEKDEQTRIG